MNRKIFPNRLILSFLLIISLISLVTNVSAIKVELVSPSLATQLNEDVPVNLTLKINDLDQRTVDDLTIETSLISSENSPIFDFGDLNKYMNAEMYKQTLHLNLSSIPKEKTITVTISGKTPSGEIPIKIKDNLVLTDFVVGELKYYEVKNGEEDCLGGMNSFKLNIQKKQQFEDTMQQINLIGSDTLKQDVRNLFEIGLVNDAQKMASDMSKMVLPPSNLMLFAIYNVKDNFALNFVVIIFSVLGIVVGILISNIFFVGK